MNAPLFQFMPLHRHFDGGFGAIGEAFKDAGDELSNRNSAGQDTHAHLPISYLYRHAVELYLKSMIVTIHRSFEKSPNGTLADAPLVLCDRKWKPFDTVHNVGGLWDCLNTLMTKHKSQLRERSETDWTELDQCEAWVRAIDAADPSGTLLKYPKSRNQGVDKQKTSFKGVSINSLTQLRSSESFVKGSVIESVDGMTECYMLDYSPISEVRETIRKCAELLSAAHFAMRCDLSDGL